MHTFRHRDGIELQDCSEIRTAMARKCNLRGTTRNWIVYLGRADGQIVLAIPNDVHHVKMTPEQAVRLGRTLIEYGEDATS